MLPVPCSSPGFPSSTYPLAPLNVSAPPYFPAVVHVAPANVPRFPFPLTSKAVGPTPSSSAYPATSPLDGGGGGGGAAVVKLQLAEYPLVPPPLLAFTRQ
jgi:hypothetical protein